jgi:hypothetical protein
MERYETQKIEVNGKQVVFYSWRFTEDERESLKAALRKFPDEKVNLFINSLEMLCILARQYLKKRNVTFQRAERKRMLGRFKKAEEDLYTLIDKHQNSKQDICLKEKKNIFDDCIFSDSTMILEKQRLHYLILAVATQLKEIQEILKSESAKPGRPSADVATGELVKIIAHGFQNHFAERPTGHLTSLKSNPSKPSPFFPVVQIALEACGLQIEDPSRHIRAALKTL